MNRFLVLGFVGFSGAVTVGCPIYSHDESGCVSDYDCRWGMVCSGYGYCVDSNQAGGSTFVPASYKGGAAGKAGAGVDGGVSARGGSSGIDASSVETGGHPGLSDSGIVSDASAAGGAGGSGGATGPDGASAGDGAVAVGGATGVGGATAAGGSDISADGGEGAGGTLPTPDSGSLDVVSAPQEGSTVDASTVYCGIPGDCAAGQTCSAGGVCVAGDCAAHACINQFVCGQSDGGLSCMRADPSACSADSECAVGNACVDGRCTPSADLCSDQTQCAGGHVCVEGKCVTSCGTDAQCPSGYRCRSELGICDIPVKGCTRTNDCGNANSVCTQNACVPRCSALGTCNEGAGVCVSNGCVPPQKRGDECETDGAATGCGAGRICLHHHCYVSCDAPNETACAALYTFAMCKTVTTSSGTHAVCGSAQNLGGECDPTIGKACASGRVCIDGFCR